MNLYEKHNDICDIALEGYTYEKKAINFFELHFLDRNDSYHTDLHLLLNYQN